MITTMLKVMVISDEDDINNNDNIITAEIIIWVLV
jgi:hypothetical protein